MGFAISAWAPLIPYAQQRLNLNHANFGLLLLCMGIGSMIAMPATGALVKRWGCRPLIAVATILLMVLLPSLTIWHSLVSMAVALFILVQQQAALALLSIYKQLWWKNTAYVRLCLVSMVCAALVV